MTEDSAGFTIDDALVLAAQAHRGERDKGRPSLPYLTHPIRIMCRFDDPELQMIAVLHDAVEDSEDQPVPVTLDLLRERGASERVVRGVESMTHRASETKEEYWARLQQNPDAVLVKNADIDDNTDPARLAILEPARRLKFMRKYAHARLAINSEPPSGA